MKDREPETQGKDFAEVLVNRLEDAYHAYAGLIENPSADDPEILEAANFRRKAREDILQALRVPSPPSEDLPSVRDLAAFAALQGMTANCAPGMVERICVGDFEKVAGWAYMHADAMMRERKASSTPEGAQA